MPEKVIALLQEWKVTSLFANISYEVDELRRDLKTCQIGQQKDIRCSFIQDKLVVNPGILKTKEGNAYAVRATTLTTVISLSSLVKVYSPWQRKWLELLNKNLDWLYEAPEPQANDKSIRSSQYAHLFNSKIPEYVDGFQCNDRDKMVKFWPAGTEVALQVCVFISLYMRSVNNKLDVRFLFA